MNPKIALGGLKAIFGLSEWHRSKLNQFAGGEIIFLIKGVTKNYPLFFIEKWTNLGFQ